MNDLLLFLTSKEIMIVYILIGAITFLSIVVWLIERSYYKRKLRNNTKELNKLVDEVGEELIKERKQEKEAEVVPVKVEEPVVDTTSVDLCIKDEPMDIVLPIEEEKNVISTPVEVIEPVYDKKDDIVYVEEDEVTQAREEIKKITESLIDTPTISEPMENIALTKFEEEQEKNSIISIDELMATKDLPRIEEEVKEYEDESNVLISITELENLKQEKLDLDIKEEPVVPLTIVKEEDIRPNINIKEETVTPKYTFKSTPLYLLYMV